VSELYCGDCLELMRSMSSGSVDMVITSPPYEDLRTYGIDFSLSGEQWVSWAVERFLECYRVSRGPVFWVLQGKTKGFRWSSTPALLMADLHRAGVNLRCPPIYHRVGIPGSGGPDWLRCDYEFIIAATPTGKLWWSNNTAVGHQPKWAPGGEMSHRHADGRRINAQLSKRLPRRQSARPSHERADKLHTKTRSDGTKELQGYTVPSLVNPGNVIRCKVGGGKMGSRLSHENEAPFPESLVEPLILSFCPPGGIVLDPFCGSGTSLAVATRLQRASIGIDIRQSQIDLSRKRVAEASAKVELFV